MNFSTTSSHRNSRFGDKVIQITNIPIATDLVIRFNKTSCVINNVNKGNFNATNNFTTNNMTIFKAATAPSQYYDCNIRIYYCKIWDNNILFRNFIPCYRKSDNVAGLYDLVNGVFYTNAGTGTFIKGNDIPYKNSVFLIKDNNNSMNIGG